MPSRIRAAKLDTRIDVSRNTAREKIEMIRYAQMGLNGHSGLIDITISVQSVVRDVVNTLGTGYMGPYEISYNAFFDTSTSMIKITAHNEVTRDFLFKVLYCKKHEEMERNLYKFNNGVDYGT